MKRLITVITFISVMVPSLISASESNAPSLPVYTLTANQLTVLNAGGPVSDIRKAEKGRINVFGAIDIYQNAESIWAVMIDCDAQLNIIFRHGRRSVLFKRRMEAHLFVRRSHPPDLSCTDEIPLTRTAEFCA